VKNSKVGSDLRNTQPALSVSKVLTYDPVLKTIKNVSNPISSIVQSTQVTVVLLTRELPAKGNGRTHSALHILPSWDAIKFGTIIHKATFLLLLVWHAGAKASAESLTRRQCIDHLLRHIIPQACSNYPFSTAADPK
jgi:hypothetical protein